MPDHDEPQNSELENDSTEQENVHPAEPGAGGSAELMLIQVAEDAAVVFGVNAPSWLETQPILGATSGDYTRLAEAATLAVGVGNVALQVSPALAAAQGVVQLSPATMAALQTMTPMVGSHGWNLGTLVVGGQFAQSVQWAPMAAASGATFAASLGTSLALVAIQVQLKNISRKLDQNIDLTKDVLAELQWTNGAELTALVRDVQRAYGEAVAIGAVTPEIYGEIRGKEHLLDKCRTLLMTRIGSYVDELDRTTTRDARRKWLFDHGERCLDDLRSLVQVHQAWFVFQALRAASIAEADISDRGAKLVTRVRRTALEQNESTVALTIGLADRLQRALGLLEESASRRLGRFKSAKEARVHAEALRALVLATVPAAATSAEPEVVLGRSDKLDRAVRMLPLLLEANEGPVLAASCLLDDSRNAFLFVTSDEVIVTREKAVFNDHRLEHRIPVSRIRFVRTEASAGRVEIASTEGFLKLKWSPGAVYEAVTYANDLLKSLMTLPAEEIPARPSSTTAALLTKTAELEAELR